MTKQDKLNDLKQKMSLDDKLPLRKGATQLVFGVGDPETNVLLIGEGPGYWEDQKGEPFVGNAGAFLNQLLAAAGLSREKVYITNVVHHRPPQNRDPEPSEIAAYQPYLDELIKIIDPKIVVTLGRFSMGKFLPSARISAVHSKKFTLDWKGKKITVVPMYHPAAGLRSAAVKEQTVNDFKKLPEYLKQLEEVSTSKELDHSGEQMNLI